MNEFQVDGMTLVGTGHVEDERAFHYVYDGEYDVGLEGVKDSKFILDVGGSLGAFTLLMMKRFPQAKIVTVEANPFVGGCLERNVARGLDPTRVTILHRALDANVRSGQVAPLTVTEDATTGGSIHRHLDWEQHPSWGNKARKVVATTQIIGVSDVLKDVGMRPDILKLDCEGSEIPILEDLRDGGHLQWIDRIVGEWHGNGTRRLVEEILKRTHEVVTYRDPGIPIGMFHARRRR